MRTTLVTLLRFGRAAGVLCFGFVAAGILARADERAALLTAIHHLENPRDLTRPGPCGELGAYQFRAGTWRMHTTAPFEQALNREMSDAVAVKHYDWIKRGLESARVPATNYNIALAWNGGLAAAIKGHAPRAAHNYAQRAVNLASTYTPPPVPLVASPAAESPPAPGVVADSR